MKEKAVPIIKINTKLPVCLAMNPTYVNVRTTSPRITFIFFSELYDIPSGAGLAQAV
jgi:hypothetical protein